MSRGRLEMGIGTGRDELSKEAVQLLGVADEPPARRPAQVEQTIDEVRELDGDQHTPVLIGAPISLSMNRCIQARARANSLTMLRGTVDEMVDELDVGATSSAFPT